MNFKSDVRNNVVVVTSMVDKLDTHTAPDLKSVFTFENKSNVANDSFNVFIFHK